jgi:hypothetical protein
MLQQKNWTKVLGCRFMISNCLWVVFSSHILNFAEELSKVHWSFLKLFTQRAIFCTWNKVLYWKNKFRKIGDQASKKWNKCKKKSLKIASKRVTKAENFITDFFFEGWPKMGQKFILLRWCNLIGFSCMGDKTFWEFFFGGL